MTKTTPNQLFTYYGGKARLATKIVKIIKQFKHRIYVEPFCGGASVFFERQTTIQSDRKSVFVLNDVNDLIITTYRVAIEQPDDLKIRLQSCLYSESLHRKAKEIIEDPEKFTDLDIAWAVVYKCRSSFCKRLDNTWERCKVDNKGALSYQNFLEYLPDVPKQLQKATVSSEDAIACINRWDSPETLFYVDPPYPGTDQGHYSGYSWDDFERLIEALVNTEGVVILSCYPNEAVPAEWEKIVFRRRCSVDIHRSFRDEVIWIKSGGASYLPTRTNIKPKQLTLF